MYGLACTLGIVATTHEAQRSVVEALKAEADAIYAQLQQEACELGSYVVGIKFNGNLGILGDAKALMHHAEDTRPMLRAEHRWRTAAEIDGGKDNIGIARGEGSTGAGAHLTKKRFDIAVEKRGRPCGNSPRRQVREVGITGRCLARCKTVEIAVRTTALAERNMHVKTREK